MKPIICSACNNANDPAPYGDARHHWLDYHHSWSHRLYWKLRRKLAAGR